LDNYESFFERPEAFIREIHSLIVKDIKQDGGQYRNSTVALSGVDFVPPQPHTVPAFMEQFSQEIKIAAIDRSPLEFAATVHTKFVWIHPFSDGNGRTARLLLNACLLAYQLPVIIVNFADRRDISIVLMKAIKVIYPLWWSSLPSALISS
jgi:Fic family protein